MVVDLPLPSRHGLREQLRGATEALSRLAAELAEEQSVVTDLRNGDAQLKQALLHVKQGLLQSARRHLAVAAAAALRVSDPIGLPGLPNAQSEKADEALQAGQRALGAAWSNLGELETLRGDKNASITAYRRTLEVSPDDVTAHAQLASLLEGRHDFAAAKAHAERALQADPANMAAGVTMARILIREQKFSDAERAALAAAKAPRAIVDERALAWSIVGDARDRLDETAAAFEAFTQANVLMRRRYRDLQQISHPAHPANVRVLTQFVSRAPANMWRAPAAFATPAPAFLIGFPRSGTTLLEQVLSSHSKIWCLGESEHLFEAMSVVLEEGDLLDRVGALTAAEIETVREAYQRVVLADNPHSEGRLIVDKHPLHIVLLPLINKIFPDAKIIFMQRDPRDVVLSCYQQCFGMNVATAQFLELERAADYYDAVMEMMMTCRARLKLDLHQVDYRDVVADLETEARRLAGFFGFSFEPAMLRYDETARTRTIATASARQVIDPIYDRSVERWRRYEPALAPVLPVLNKWARRLGYDD